MHSNRKAQLVALGWDQWFVDRFDQVASSRSFAGSALLPARVVADQGAGRVVHTGEAVHAAALSRPLTRASRHGTDPALPAVGDWVAIRVGGEQPLIEAVLERRSAFRRKVAGPTSDEQVLAANVDITLVVAALDDGPNLRRIERALAVAWSSDTQPIVVLSKADLAAPDIAGSLRGEVEHVAAGAPVVALSAVTGEGIERLPELLPAGRTAVLLGPSGVGKSTLLNRLVGDDVMRTGAVRSDGKGRHTTTHRQLVAMPWGGLLIDTPGLRELQLWADVEEAGGVARLFADVEQLASRCRFSDCGHTSEPGCAIRAAVARAELTEGRLESYRKLTREAETIRRHVGQRHARQAARGRRRRIAHLREEEQLGP
ncbi:MAG TPA: ribosome small subunit-dependent GTPase A [Candidatus Dormibacteraeota bacterium]